MSCMVNNRYKNNSLLNYLFKSGGIGNGKIKC